MEKNSTHRGAVLPRATNLATLAVVVAATWWSGAQRPAGQAPISTAEPTKLAAALPLSQSTEVTATSAPTSTPAVTPAVTTTSAYWPAQATTIAREGMQAVGFQTHAQR